MKKPYQLNPDQAAILRVMAKHAQMLKQEVFAECGVGKNPFARAFDALAYRDLVADSEQPAGRGGWRSSCITMAGRRALADYEAALQVGPPPAPVPPARIDVFRLPVFQQSSSRAFVRNDGHKHIASRGIAC